jgi:hypothetical protein
MGARDAAAGAYAVIGRFVSGRETLTRIVPGPMSYCRILVTGGIRRQRLELAI